MVVNQSSFYSFLLEVLHQQECCHVAIAHEEAAPVLDDSVCDHVEGPLHLVWFLLLVDECVVKVPIHDHNVSESREVVPELHMKSNELLSAAQWTQQKTKND